MLGLLAVGISAPVICIGETIDAFTEPYLRVAIPSPENGVIKELLVKEGDIVTEKQRLASLDDSVLRSSLELALSASNARGAFRIAEADVEIKQQHLKSYQTLMEDGNATNREITRARMDLDQSRARLQSVREEQELRRLEYERVKKQIRQRQLEAPIHGVVVSISKQVGEFVSMTDPVVMEIVQLDALKAVFSVPRGEAVGLERGQMIQLDLGFDADPCEGVIEFVSPIANPESNTVQVKLRIENQDQSIQSGVTCRWAISNTSAKPSARDKRTPQHIITIPTARK